MVNRIRIPLNLQRNINVLVWWHVVKLKTKQDCIKSWSLTSTELYVGYMKSCLIIELICSNKVM